MPLSILIWLPVVAALIGAVFPGRRAAGWAAAAGSFGALAIAIGYAVSYDNHGLQWVTDQVWIREFGIHYKLGLDGLNLFMILLTAAMFAGAILWAAFKEWDRPRLFFFHFALAESAVLGALAAQDLILFVVFFDLMLVPFYFLIGMWGVGERRVAATLKLFIYTLVGSLLMLAAAIATGVIASKGHDVSFAFSDLAQVRLSRGVQYPIFLAFVAAFFVKMPLFPVHGWMPDGYRAMPLPVLAVFSAVLSKVAAYGFLRVVLPLFPEATVHFQLVVLLFALASVLYGSIMAFTQTNVRLIIGYSSMAQLGFIVLGIFALNPQGAQGALLQMINHGVVVVPIFFVIALLSERAGGSEDITEMGGIAFRAPVLAALFLIITFATLAMPGSSNFVGEFLILLGVFNAKLAIALIASVGVVLASVYALRAFIRTMHNRVGPNVDSREMTLSDGFVLVPLVAVILALAVYPQVALKKGERSVNGSIRTAQRIANPPKKSAQASAGVQIGQPAPTPTAGAQGQVQIDPQTGQPVQVDPSTGQPVQP